MGTTINKSPINVIRYDAQQRRECRCEHPLRNDACATPQIESHGTATPMEKGRLGQAEIFQVPPMGHTGWRWRTLQETEISTLCQHPCTIVWNGSKLGRRVLSRRGNGRTNPCKWSHVSVTREVVGFERFVPVNNNILSRYALARESNISLFRSSSVLQFVEHKGKEPVEPTAGRPLLRFQF